MADVGELQLRLATAGDAPALAALHADSWRLSAETSWGALLDNLHVTYGRKRLGIGTRLLAATAQGVLDRSPGSGLYLWVLEQNTAAQAFTPPAAAPASRPPTCRRLAATRHG